MAHITQIKPSAQVALQLPEIFVAERGEATAGTADSLFAQCSGGNKAEAAYLVALQAAKFSPAAAHPAIMETGAVPSLQ